MHAAAAFGAGFGGADDLRMHLAAGRLGDAKIAVFAINSQPATDERVVPGVIDDKGGIDFVAAQICPPGI
tara:strand:+ start:45 stop:254 length:210 start_codon:yes stop_codon:yes gene_type:complete